LAVGAIWLIVVSALLSGCNLLVPAGYMVGGTGKNPAEHELDEVKTLVFVDDRKNFLPRSVLRANLALSISEGLLVQKLVPAVVDSADAMAMVRTRERSGDLMAMESIARETGVQQIIFVEMESFTKLQRSLDLRPGASCKLRVMHFGKGGRVYPEVNLGDVGERRVTVQLREVAPENLRSASDRRRVEIAVMSKLSIDVVKLFHEHEARDLGENLGIR
jgi:hypothetical protein